MKIPNEVLHIINILNENGFEAFIVGGCVRDLILHKKPNDWDITTSAPPDIINHLFDKTVPTGIKYGTITVILSNKSFEVTTYRHDEMYTNHRQPDTVKFTTSLHFDLQRRDFTMNAISYNPKIGFIDLFNGTRDIKNKIIKCIGNADIRFSEDALRMLRAIRFSCTLGFSIEQETLRSITKNASLIKSISGERISNELKKIIMGKYSNRFILLYETQILQNLFPFVSNCKSIIKNALKKVSTMPYNLESRLCMLIIYIIHELNNIQHLDEIFNRLKFSKKLSKLVSTLYKYYDYKFRDYKLDTKILINKIGKETFLEMLELYKYTNKDYNRILNEYNNIIKNNEPIFISDLKISGGDLKNLGVKDTKIGNTLIYLLRHCFKYPNHNTQKILIELANKYKIQE